MTSSSVDAPVAIITGFFLAATYSISSSQSISPEPILNAETNGSMRSTDSKSYGVDRKEIFASSHSRFSSGVQSGGTEASSYTSVTDFFHLA